MSTWRKLAVAVAIFLFGVGLWLLLYDLWFIQHFDFDFNDVIFLGGEDFADWPTGERPSWTFIPLFACSIPFFTAGLLFLLFRPQPSYRGRIRLGTE